jgi:hypothetical protein
MSLSGPAKREGTLNEGLEIHSQRLAPCEDRLLHIGREEGQTAKRALVGARRRLGAQAIMTTVTGAPPHCQDEPMGVAEASDEHRISMSLRGET